MEEALLLPFLKSEMMFSLIYDNYEKDLKKELWLCHKNMKLSMTEIERMPIRDRKYFIREHNKMIQTEMQKYNNRRKKH